MLPVSLALAFPAGVGVAGMWYGEAVGTALAAAAFLLLLRRTDFAASVADAKTRLPEEQAASLQPL